MSSDCGQHKWHQRHRNLLRLLYITIALIVLAGLAILIGWLVLRPTKPEFSLTDASVKVFDVSTTTHIHSVINTTIQVSITYRNPNNRVGIYYDNLKVYASYHYQRITLPTRSPYDTYQGTKDVTIWSPILNGASIPIVPYVAKILNQEENAGLMILYVMIEGKVRWKVGSWVFGKYHLFVKCPAFLNTSTPPAFIFQLQQDSRCSVDV